MPSLFEGDATGNDALAMARILRGGGWDVRMVAENAGPGIDFVSAAEAGPLLARRSTLVVYHQSTWWDRGLQLLRSARGPRVVRDHNVTPASFFEGVHPDFVRAAEGGAEQRARLAREPVTAFLAASATNARELEALGADPARLRVVTPFHRAEELASAAPDEPALRRWSRGGATVTFVGRIAPHKGHLRMLRVAAVHRELFGEPIRLRLVGSFDTRWARWRAAVDRAVRLLRLADQVEIVGPVSEGELKAAYLTSHAMLCCSEHEGFCVPLVEAARLGVPVVAARQSAVADTLGPEGLVVDGDDDLLATALHRVLHDGALRDRLVLAQKQRYDRLWAPAVLERSFLDALGPLARPSSAGY
ncbi:MAG: glycosyltransferase family 4 protein [Alphaproteobacteria bacterium]